VLSLDFSLGFDQPILQVRQLAVPSTSTLAVATKSQQLQEKVEQQQLKQLVLDYEQREEAEEMKGTSTGHPLLCCSEQSAARMESQQSGSQRNRGQIKIRLAG
jgi:regulator of nonsense transcripts 2